MANMDCRSSLNPNTWLGKFWVTGIVYKINLKRGSEVNKQFTIGLFGIYGLYNFGCEAIVRERTD